MCKYTNEKLKLYAENSALRIRPSGIFERYTCSYNINMHTYLGRYKYLTVEAAQHHSFAIQESLFAIRE